MRGDVHRLRAPMGGGATQVLVGRTAAFAPERLGEFVGRLTHDELAGLDGALRLALELD